MKKVLILPVLALLLAFILLPVVSAKQENKKVVICHATSSETNPWVRIVVSENAIGGHFNNPGSPKAGHEDDVLLPEGSVCPYREDEPDEEPKEKPDKPITHSEPTQPVIPENEYIPSSPLK